MPQTPHIEKHFTASDTVRDIVIGMADGLTVPFALAAGLSGAVVASTVIPHGWLCGNWPPAPLPWAWAVTWPPAAMPNTSTASGVREQEEIVEKPEPKQKRCGRFSYPNGLTS
jgi:hypothetical protein